MRVSAALKWKPQSLPDDDCGDAGGSWQFSRVNCWGKLETRASANRLPGHCGLLYSLLLERAGPLANAGVAEKRFCESYSQSYALRPVLVNAALFLFGERCRTSTVGSLLLAAGRQGERSTSDAAGVAGPGRICFCKTLLPRICTDLHGSIPVGQSDSANFRLRTCFLRTSTR